MANLKDVFYKFQNVGIDTMVRNSERPLGEKIKVKTNETVWVDDSIAKSLDQNKSFVLVDASLKTEPKAEPKAKAKQKAEPKAE